MELEETNKFQKFDSRKDESLLSLKPHPEPL